MDVLQIPFNEFLGVEDSGTGDYIFRLEPRQQYLNHLGTIHASALFALAEASSGEFLLRRFGELNTGIIPVVRKAGVKFSKPVNDTVFSKACFTGVTTDAVLDELKTRKRAIIHVKVDLYCREVIVFTADFEWFIAMK